MSETRLLKCSILVRTIPLERYRLPNDGRKWKQAARSRSDLLLRLSSYANGDGTFVRDGRNYSPSLETLEKHVAEKSYFRLTNALQELGLLSWTRERHYDRRIYVIHFPETGPGFDQEQVRDSEKTPVTFEAEHLSDSDKSPVTLDAEGGKHLSHSPDHLSHWPKSPVTMGDHPSLPSEEPSREKEPSAAATTGNASLPHWDFRKPGGQEQLGKAVDYVMENAKEESEGKAQFSKTARRDLADALRELGRVEYHELNYAITAKLNSCTDDTAFVIFGSSLAADLVASIRRRRKQLRAKFAKKQTDKASQVA